MIAVLVVCGCAARASGPANAAAAAKPAAPTGRDKLIDEVTEAIQRADYASAGAVVERARGALPPGEPAPGEPSPALVAYFDATVRAYQGDYRGAAEVMYKHVAKVGPTVRAAFDFHNAMIALRTADGDLLGALVECEEMTKAGTAGTWEADGGDRMTWVGLKEHWHRAYLLRMVAQTLEGPARVAFVGYAERARQAYVALATKTGNLEDSIAVLDAYFAFCDGVPAAMRAAAMRVKVAESDDAEDLYLTQLALDGAGEAAAAAAVRARILAFPSVTLMVPIIRGWIQADAADGPPQFSPRHPTGARPAR